MSLDDPNSSTCLKFLQTTFLLPICKMGVFPTQTQEHDFRCWKSLFSCWLASAESYQTKLMYITLDYANYFCILSISKGGELLINIVVCDTKCCKRLFSFSLARRSLANKHSCACLSMLQTTYSFQLAIVLLTLTQVHDSKYCKRLLFFPLANEVSYTPKP